MNVYETYLSIKPQIDVRLKEFENNREVLREGLFCLCTPQTDAHKAWNAVAKLNKNLTEGEVAAILKVFGVRFHKTKAKRIIKYFKEALDYSTIQFYLDLIFGSVKDLRDMLAKSISGWGLKEASHFLRNIGFGNDICILDRHILRNLKELKIIKEIPKLNKKTYHKIENEMIVYAKKVNVPVAALDLVFWWNSKGEIFR